MTLSKKMKDIVDKLGITQQEFIKNIQEANKELDTKMSENSLKRIFSGKFDGAWNKPTLVTIKKIIDYLKTSDNPDIKNISYDYLLNDNNINMSLTKYNTYEDTYLKDETIEKIKKVNLKKPNILNDFIQNINEDFWENIRVYKEIEIYKTITAKLQNMKPSDLNKNRELLKEKLSLENIFFPEKNISTFYSYEEQLRLNRLIEDVNFHTFSDDDIVTELTQLIDTKKLEEQIEFRLSKYLTLYLNSKN